MISYLDAANLIAKLLMKRSGVDYVVDDIVQPNVCVITRTTNSPPRNLDITKVLVVYGVGRLTQGFRVENHVWLSGQTRTETYYFDHWTQNMLSGEGATLEDYFEKRLKGVIQAAKRQARQEEESLVRERMKNILSEYPDLRFKMSTQKLSIYGSGHNCITIDLRRLKKDGASIFTEVDKLLEAVRDLHFRFYGGDE